MFIDGDKIRIVFWPNEGPIPHWFVVQAQRNNSEFTEKEGTKLVFMSGQNPPITGKTPDNIIAFSTVRR